MPIPEGEIGVGGLLRSTYLDAQGNPGPIIEPGEIEGVPTDNSGLGLVFRPNADGSYPAVTDAMVDNGVPVDNSHGIQEGWPATYRDS